MCRLPLPTFWVSPFLYSAFPAPANALAGHKLVMSPALQFTLCPLPATASQILPVCSHHVTCLAFFLDHAPLEMKADAFLKALGTTHWMANGSVTSHKTWVLIMKFTLYSYCCVVAMVKQYASTVVKFSYMVHILILSFFFFSSISELQFLNFEIQFHFIAIHISNFK
jgi:hypothetical protein